MRTIVDSTVYSEDVRNAMIENEKLHDELETVKSRSLSLDTLKPNDRLFQFFTN